MRDLTAFQRDLLHIIAGLDEPPGTRIREELEDYYQEGVYSGKMYPNLDTLAEKELIRKGKHDDRTNLYELTEKGEKRLDQRAAWENGYYRPRPSPPTVTQGN